MEKEWNFRTNHSWQLLITRRWKRNIIKLIHSWVYSLLQYLKWWILCFHFLFIPNSISIIKSIHSIWYLIYNTWFDRIIQNEKEWISFRYLGIQSIDLNLIILLESDESHSNSFLSTILFDCTIENSIVWIPREFWTIDSINFISSEWYKSFYSNQEYYDWFQKYSRNHSSQVWIDIDFHTSDSLKEINHQSLSSVNSAVICGRGAGGFANFMFGLV